MKTNWRDQLNSNPSLRKLDSWPTIDPDSLPAKHRSAYHRNRLLIGRVLSGYSISSVASEHGISESYISQLLNRCLASRGDTPPALTQGLIPYKRLTKHRRRVPLDSHGKRTGHQNAFQALLDAVPGMRAGLDAMLDDRIKDKPTAQVESVGAFFGEFKRRLREAQWPTDQYPYTTKSMAYEALRRHYHERCHVLKQAKIKDPNRIIAAPTPIYRALKSIQIDTQKVDLNTSVNVALNDEIEPLRVSRVSLLLAVEKVSSCILAYHLALSDEPNQDDLLQLLDNLRRHWEPLALTTPGLEYVPGSGFPTMWMDIFQHLTVDEVKLDNALVHLAYSIRDVVCLRMGATLNLGLPGVPLGRNLIEATFRQINRTTHRFVSTTGSHPNDPIKESRKNRKRPPVLTLRQFEEILSVQIAAKNVVPRAELNNQTPLDVVRSHVNQHYVRLLTEPYDQSWSPFESEKICSVICLKSELRHPFIRFAYTRYKGKCLHSLAVDDVRKLRIRYDRRDIRHVRAYSPDGVFVGVLSAPSSWQRFAHSLYTRKKIFKEMKSWRRQSADPLAEYFHRIAEQRHLPSNALELIRIFREARRITLDPSPEKDSMHDEAEQVTNQHGEKLTDETSKKGANHAVNNEFKRWHSSFAHSKPTE